MSGAFADLVIDGYAPALHDRFANDPGFIAAAYDLSGIARSTNNHWGTLVSPNVVLSAEHWHPATGEDLVFFATNDPFGPSETRTILAGERIGNTDLWIGIIDQSLPNAYSPIPVLDEPLSSVNDWESSSTYLAEIFMVGRSDNSTSSFTNLAVGKNRIEIWYDNLDVDQDGFDDSVISSIQHLPGDDGYITYEAQLDTYDSGAPVVRDAGGQLELVGINWFVGQEDIHPSPTQGLRNTSGFSYAGNYAAEIASVSAAFQRDVSPAYFTWSDLVFPSGSTLAYTGPSADFDWDGILNFLEFAFVLDPTDPTSVTPVVSSHIRVSGNDYLLASFAVREDLTLQYFVQIGTGLAASTRVDLSFNGSAWSSLDPGSVVVENAIDQGDGSWLLSVRAASPITAGGRYFLSAGVE